MPRENDSKKSTAPRRQQIRQTHVKKTHSILFSNFKVQEARKYAKEVVRGSGVQVEHKLEKMAGKRRLGIVCSINFMEGIKTDRRKIQS